MRYAYVFEVTDQKSGDAAIDYFLPFEGQLLVGRSKDTDITLDCSGISRRHLLVTHRSGKAFIEDLGSSNGTFLNGERLHEQRLLRGADRITLGPSVVIKVSECRPEEHTLRELMDGHLVISPPRSYHSRPVYGRPEPPRGVRLDELLELCQTLPGCWRVCAHGRADAFVVMARGEVLAAQCGEEADRLDAFIALLALPDTWTAARHEHDDSARGTPWDEFMDRVRARLTGRHKYH